MEAHRDLQSVEEGRMEHRSSAWSLNWLAGVVLIVLGAAFLVGQLGFFLDDLTSVVVLGGIGVTFLAIYLADRSKSWALIPAYIMGAVAGLVLISSFWWQTNLAGVFVLMAIGLPFLYVYLRDRSRWWALALAYILFMMAAAILLEAFFWWEGNLAGAFITAVIGLPFLYVYVRNRQHWWALIPAYIMFTVSGGILLEYLFPYSNVVGGFICAALAVPFFYIYLRDHGHWWALIPGGVLASVSVAILFAELQVLISVVLIVGGLLLLVGRPVARSAPPASGPQADQGT